MNLQSSRWASSHASRSSYRPKSPSRSLRSTNPNPNSCTNISSIPPYSTCSRHNNNNASELSQPSSTEISPDEQARLHRSSELARHRRLLRRLRWKLPYLATSHHLATTVDLSHHHYGGILSDDVAALDAARCEAELMFKLDWFEYYTLLERALLHLLGVFDIRISRHGDRDDNTAGVPATGGDSETASIIGIAAYASPYAHRFHANVLASLDMPSNPLHEMLGQGEVRASLAKAKELRNRWKDADERAADEVRQVGKQGKRGDGSPAPLSSFDTERILWSIFEGFERALDIAERAVRETTTVYRSQMASMREHAEGTQRAEDEDGDMMMEDAMDWEDP